MNTFQALVASFPLSLQHHDAALWKCLTVSDLYDTQTVSRL
jgi:hypothetical protein